MSGLDVWSDAIRRKLTAALIEHAPTGPRVEQHLHAAITATVRGPGKLVRPTLAYATMTVNGADDETALAVAAALEYFHLASLILDDLPSMDDATTRRGEACLHRVHGEATTILAALAFINRGYALVGFALAPQSGLVRVQAQACLDACLGSAGLLGGQARDLRFKASDRSVREVSQIALGKTGAMLSLSLLLPALWSGAGAIERRHLGTICTYWSLAFQALDDVQDVIGSSVGMGKTAGRDRVLTRPNLAIVLGTPAARRRIARLLSQAERTVQRLVALRPQWEYLGQFQRYFATAAAPVLGTLTEEAA